MSIDGKDILARVRENRRKLDSCPEHVFTIGVGNPIHTAADGVSRYMRYQCVACRGQVQMTDKYWYERGLQDGKDIANGHGT